jgi:uncharacterized protein (DUF2126 family)
MLHKANSLPLSKKNRKEKYNSEHHTEQWLPQKGHLQTKQQNESQRNDNTHGRGGGGEHKTCKQLKEEMSPLHTHWQLHKSVHKNILRHRTHNSLQTHQQYQTNIATKTTLQKI